MSKYVKIIGRLSNMILNTNLGNLFIISEYALKDRLLVTAVRHQLSLVYVSLTRWPNETVISDSVCVASTLL